MFLPKSKKNSDNHVALFNFLNKISVHIFFILSEKTIVIATAAVPNKAKNTNSSNVVNLLTDIKKCTNKINIVQVIKGLNVSFQYHAKRCPCKNLLCTR